MGARRYDVDRADACQVGEGLLDSMHGTPEKSIAAVFQQGAEAGGMGVEARLQLRFQQRPVQAPADRDVPAQKRAYHDPVQVHAYGCQLALYFCSQIASTSR